MRNWIFAAVIGLATCGQAWAWDEDRFQELVSEYESARASEEYRAKQEREARETDEQLFRNSLLFEQERSRRLQEESLKIEKRRLEIEEDRERDRKLGY